MSIDADLLATLWY